MTGIGFGILLIAGIGNVSLAGFTGLAQANADGLSDVVDDMPAEKGSAGIVEGGEIDVADAGDVVHVRPS